MGCKAVSNSGAQPNPTLQWYVRNVHAIIIIHTDDVFTTNSRQGASLHFFLNNKYTSWSPGEFFKTVKMKDGHWHFGQKWRMARTPWVAGHVWSESFPSWTSIKALLTPSARDLLAHLRSATNFLSQPKIWRKNGVVVKAWNFTERVPCRPCGFPFFAWGFLGFFLVVEKQWMLEKLLYRHYFWIPEVFFGKIWRDFQNWICWEEM